MTKYLVRGLQLVMLPLALLCSGYLWCYEIIQDHAADLWASDRDIAPY